MIRKSKHTEYIDKYLSQELTGEELREFNAELAINPELEEEIELHKEIEMAIQEKDVINLRKKLQGIINQENEEELEEFAHIENQAYNFELSEDFSSFTEFSSPVNMNDLTSFSQSLPILHLAQHKIAEKENIHQFYKEQLNQDSVSDEDSKLTPQDEAIFADVQSALAEKDILDLRANLQQIAANAPAHEHSSLEIEQYINNELEGQLQADFEADLLINSGLAKDIALHLDIDDAIGENDIMDLRANLKNIQQTESSTARKIEEIDQYLNTELSEEELASFETEMSNNPDLVAEIDLYKEIDKAVQETEIMNLRAKLENIGKDIVKEKRKERSFVTRLPKTRVAIATVAASLMLLLSITGLISRNRSASNTELYSQYYESYEATGIFRSGDAIVDNKISQGLHQFNAQKYDEALTLFNEVLATDESNPVANFYTAMALQQKGEFDQAVDTYKKVIKAGSNLFMEQAEWYIGLCYLQTDNRKKAYSQFKRLAESESYYSEKATAILRKIKYIE